MRILCVLLAAVSGAGAISCRNQYDYDVQWFAAMKMPDNVNGDTVGSKQGLGFYYLDVDDRSSFKPSAVSIDQPHQAIGYSLSQYYDNINDPDLLHVFYNDEPAENVTAFSNIHVSEDAAVQYGHTKGVLLFDSKSDTGIWLIHSVPKFPIVQKYVYPTSGTDYGQSFLCLTLDKNTLAQLGTVLYYNHPDVYSYTLPDWAVNMAPDLVKVLQGKYNSDATDTHYQAPITVTNGNSGPAMQVFAKSYQYNFDLWSGLVAPAYKSSLEAETWRRGDLIDTICTDPYPVFDAQTIKIGATDEYKYTKDHSKYARTLDAADPTVCIGDINRMTSQYVRGGGTVCIVDTQLWNAYSVFRQLPTC